MNAITAAHEGDIQMIDSTSVCAHHQAATVKRGIEIIGSVAPAADSRPKYTRSSTGKACRTAKARPRSRSSIAAFSAFRGFR